MRAIVLLLCLIGFVSTGCPAVQQLSEAVAENAPPAKIPELENTRKLRTWPGDQLFYSSGTSFELDIKYGFANNITIKEDGKAVPNQDSSLPDDDQRTVVRRTDLIQDHKQKIAKTHLVILPKVIPGGPTHGTRQLYTFVENSINPTYKGTSQEESAPATLEIIIVRKPCNIKKLAIPPRNTSNVQISWEVENCRQVELFLGDTLVRTQTGTTFDGTLTGSFNLQVYSGSQVTLKCTNSAGRTISTNSPVSTTAQSPCPGGQPLKEFTFCVDCNGHISEWTQKACTAEEAKNVVQQLNANCTVTAAPASGECN